MGVHCGEREPGTLHLDLEFVAGAEAVADVDHGEVEFKGLPRLQGFGVLRRVAPSGGGDVGAHQRAGAVRGDVD